jgi:S-layer protein (TIGR01567 family)
MKTIWILVLLSLLLILNSYAKDPDIYIIGFDISKGSSEEAQLVEMAKINNGTYISAEDATTPRQLQIALQQAYRGQFSSDTIIQMVIDGATYTWTKDNLPGLFYDIDDDIGRETLNMTITGNELKEPHGLMYSSTSQDKKFEFDDWGEFKVMGFLGKEYFAGYSGESLNGTYPILYDESDNANLLIDEQLSEVLINDDTERTITGGTPLELNDGYQLSIKSIDINGDKVYLELIKDSQIIDAKAIQPSVEGATMSDQTYYFKKDVGDTEDLVTIAVHFKNAFTSADKDMSTVDGIFQISDTPTPVKVDSEYGLMSIASIDASKGIIIMDNEDNSITLNKDKDIEFMPDFKIKTADQENITVQNPLRFYVYMADESENSSTRGPVQIVSEGSVYNLSTQSFAGFFYDIDDDIGRETLNMSITGNKLKEPHGLIYTSTSLDKKFEFNDWGEFKVMGFLGKEYFAGYSGESLNGTYPLLYDESDNANLLVDEQLSEVLINDDTERTITSGTPLELNDGYQLSIKSIDINGDKVYLELIKDSQIIDAKAIQPSVEGATMSDETYYFKKDVGDTEDIVTIAVHFKNAFNSADKDMAIVDGIFQISDTPTPVKIDSEYGVMSIASIDASKGIIIMDNEDNAITLNKNKDIEFMPDFNIKTADQEQVTVNDPLRFYIYKRGVSDSSPI